MERLTHALPARAAALAAMLTVAACFLCGPAPARAQWATSGNNISNTNTGAVGVGTSTPGNYRIHVFGVGSSLDAMIANYFGSSAATVESQSGVRVGILNNYQNQTGVGEAARGVVSLGYSNGYASVLTGFYSRQRVWHNDSVGYGVFAVSEADSSGSAGQRLFGGRFEAKTTDVSGGAGNVAYGVFAKGAVGSSTNVYHSAYGVMAQAAAAAGTDSSVTTYAVYADATNSGAGTAFGIYSASGRNYFNGRVGVGTASPAYSLDVQGGQVNASGGLCIANDCRTSWPAASSGGSPSGWSENTGAMTVSVTNGSARVGIGTSAPGERLEVYDASAPVKLKLSAGGATANSYLVMNAAAGRASVIQKQTGGADGGQAVFYASDDAAGRLFALDAGNGFGEATAQLMVRRDGRVGVNTANPTHTLEVNGTINASGAITGGSIQATYQDVAEWVPSVQKLGAGTVVVLDTGRTNHVVASTKAYDTGVAGVVSAEPGVILGVGGEGKVKVASTGRVRVRVDARGGAIKVGDLLVTSDVEGIAMKSIPVELGGTQIHRPGTIIGKALEPLASGTGEILVLLSLQ